jgi:hypothetical protein
LLAVRPPAAAYHLRLGAAGIVPASFIARADEVIE